MRYRVRLTSIKIVETDVELPWPASVHDMSVAVLDKVDDGEAQWSPEDIRVEFTLNPLSQEEAEKGARREA